MNIDSEHLHNLIRKQVDDKGVVVWYDPEGTYSEAVLQLELPGTTVLHYEGSFVQLRSFVFTHNIIHINNMPDSSRSTFPNLYRL